MGVFNNLKKKMKQLFNRNKAKTLNPAQQNPQIQNTSYGVAIFPTSNPGEHITIRDIKYNTQVKHSNGIKTYLMLAKVAVATDGERERLDDGEYVAFEIEQGSQISQVMLQKIAMNYIYEKNSSRDQQKECYYIGEVNNNPNVNYINKSSSVQQYVEKLDGQIKGEKASRDWQERMDLQKKVENSYRYDESNLNNQNYDYVAIQEQRRLEKVNQIDKLYLEQTRLHDSEYEKKYHDYNATNTYTGDFLKIRKLNKVAKDENGRYIYTAFLQQATSLDHAEYIPQGDDDPWGVPVCFTIDGRFEDIVKNQNPAEMKPLLDMLSSRETFDRSHDRLNYIGCLEKSGNVNRDMYNNSPAIVNTISNLQKQFYEKNQRTNDSQEK